MSRLFLSRNWGWKRPGQVLGEVRAFHNADPQKVNEEGLMACTASVRTTYS